MNTQYELETKKLLLKTEYPKSKYFSIYVITICQKHSADALVLDTKVGIIVDLKILSCNKCKLILV